MTSKLCSGRVAFITGAAGGLGKEFSDRVLSTGGWVCLADLNAELGHETLKHFRERFGEDKVCFVPCDVTNPEDLEKGEAFYIYNCNLLLLITIIESNMAQHRLEDLLK